MSRAARYRLWLPMLSAAMALSAQASGNRAPAAGAAPAAFVEECGSCHVAYPARFLPADTWRAVMGNLADHFGTDASLDEATAREIETYLAANARRKATPPVSTLRITAQRWFEHEHRRVLKRRPPPAVKSAADCGGCHRRAAEGSFREREIRIPANGETP